MPDSIGAHLLGRLPSPPDNRDWKLKPFLEAETPLDVLLAHLVASHTAKAVKPWATAVTQLLNANAPVKPQPTPPPSDAMEWEMLYHLNQGQTPRCVGFGTAGWEGCAPVEDAVTNADGDRIYLECKKIDGYPNQDGTDVRSAAKVLVAEKRMAAYAFASTIDEVVQWIQTKGPVILGTNWYTSMFTPDSHGVITISGQIEGGHCTFGKGYDPATKYVKCQNSWGTDWGDKGDFYLHVDDVARLLSEQGEAMVGLELPA